MTPEDVLGSLVTHSAALHVGKPDPLVMENRDKKIGKVRPMNWRRLQIGSGNPAGIIELWPGTRSASLRDSRSVSRFSVSEIAADALSGMPVRHWHTLQVAIGQGGSVRPILKSKLERIAYRERGRGQKWPNGTKRKPSTDGRSADPDYVHDLVELALRELAAPRIYNTARIRAAWFGISERYWHARFKLPYDRIAAHPWSWYHAGIGHIKGRIAERQASVFELDN